jgi:hypothetical protein
MSSAILDSSDPETGERPESVSNTLTPAVEEITPAFWHGGLLAAIAWGLLTALMIVHPPVICQPNQ